ncbi:MAG TPA: hypothetical protein PL029_08540, partial [Bacteroidia bacterium]|nr:hypothetical protein [Bacteroidia bacterium]
MSKLLFSLAFVILFVVVCSSQNLVPNPSFEDTTGCPEIWSEIDKAKGWNACGYGTPDFFCNCPKAGNLMGVPFNFNGFQLARTGNGYAGIYTYNGSVPTGVEIITAKLVTPLIKGGKYYVKFFVSRADDTLSVNKIGVRFSMDSCNKLSNVALNNFAHIYTNSVNTDRISWSQISGVLIAD